MHDLKFLLNLYGLKPSYVCMVESLHFTPQSIGKSTHVHKIVWYFEDLDYFKAIVIQQGLQCIYLRSRGKGIKCSKKLD